LELITILGTHHTGDIHHKPSGRLPLLSTRPTSISICDQPPRSTQPGHVFVGRYNEYQPKSGDALWLGSKGSYGSCVGGR